MDYPARFSETGCGEVLRPGGAATAEPSSTNPTSHFTDVAFLYHDGTMEDLNDAIDHDENGWPRIHTATGINDGGQIVGNAYFGDRPGLHAFLLTPAPATPPQ